ncbi:MAG: membrane dipeptidase [Anaerolineae bacterium]|nr:membrane dipeptidase [Anaerolineae bacterium]
MGEDALRLHREATVVDVHAHPALKASLFRRSLASRGGPPAAAFSPFSLRTSFPRLEEGGVDVLFSAIHVPEARLLADVPLLRLLRLFAPGVWREIVTPSYFQATLNSLQTMEAQVEAGVPGQKRYAQVVRNVAELDAVLAGGPDAPVAIVHTIEGAHSLQGEAAGKEVPGNGATAAAEAEILANLETLAARGVALITLAHFYPNYVASPCFQFPEAMLRLARWRAALRQHDLTRGLGPVGETVVRRMFELGLLVDVTHCTPVARAEVYQIAEDEGADGQVVATHVGAQAINPSPYNLADWEIRWLGEHGGFAGVIFMNYWLMPHETRLGLNFIERTLAHFIDAGGEEVAALGTDFDGFTDPPDDLLDASQLPRLTQWLSAARSSPAAPRYGEETIRKILGGNALRVLRAAWGRRP